MEEPGRATFHGVPKRQTKLTLVKNLSAMHEMQVRPLGREDRLEKQTATCSSIIAWKIPRTKEPGGRQSMGPQES